MLVKQVPEVAEMALDPVTRRLRRDGVPLQVNPFDRRAVLEAIRLKEELGATVAVVTMGPPAAEAALRECLGLGADRAVHLSDRLLAGADTLATARALADAIARIGADLVLAGRYSIDAETGQVGPEVAEMLGWGFLGGVRRMALLAADGATPLGAGEADPRGAALRAECETDDGAIERVAPLPVLITCTDRWKTRVPIVLPDEERAATAAVERWGVGELGRAEESYGAAGSPTWVEEVRAVEVSRARRVVDARVDLPAAIAAVRAEIDRALAADAAASRAARGAVHDRVADPRGAIWVVAERSPAGPLRPVVGELLGAADAIAARLGVGVAAVAVDALPGAIRAGLPPRPGADVSPAALGALGADVLLCPATGGVGALDPAVFVDAMAAAVRALSPRAILAPATSLGRDLVPALAARLGLGLTGDAIGIDVAADGSLLHLKPAFGGQVVAPVRSRTRPDLATIRPGLLAGLAPDPLRPPALAVDLPPAADGRRRPDGRWLSFVGEVESDGSSLEEARAVVCVGWGLGQRDRVGDAERLARALGGAVAATRRVCDGGWLPRQVQVGISGRSIAPAIYLGLGVRGSFNHLVGLSRAGTVIAVNRDPDAEVFAAADLGVIGDAAEVLAGLLAELGG